MLFAWALVVAAALAGAEGFSSGAPESVCVDMVPKHPVAAQKSPAPYKITTSAKVAKAGQPIQVIVTGNAPSNTLRGLLLQARQGTKIVGAFTLAPGDKFAKLLACDGPGSAVTHKKHEEKLDPQTVTYTWTPPAGLTGEIKFRATIAFNGAVFWVGVESAPVKINK